MKPFSKLPDFFSSIQHSTSLIKNSLFTIRYSLFIILLLFSLSLFAQQWTEPLNITNLGGYSMHPDMMIDHNGVIHVVWSYKITSSHWLIMYAYSEDDGNTWSEPLDLLQNTELWMSQPHIACDSKNNLYVTYDYNTINPSMMLVYIIVFDGQQWNEPVLVSENMYGSSYNKMIMDNNNQLILGWYKNGKFYYRFFENSIFSEIYCPYCYEEDKYLPVEGALNTNQEIHWIGSSSSGNYYGERLQYYLFDIISNSWSEPQMPVQDTITVGKDIALNNDDIPESVYRKKSTISVGVTTDSTMHIKKEGNLWGNPDLVSGRQDYQAGQQIVVDQNNETHIVEDNETTTGDGLEHFMKQGNTWVGQYIDTCYAIGFPKLLYNKNKLYCVYTKAWEVEKEVYFDLFFASYDIITNIKEEPNSSSELKIFPNPGKDNIYIEFENNKKQHIDLSVFDITGKHIITLVSETRPRGLQRLLWKGTDKNGKEDAPHLYLVRLQLGRKIVMRKVVVLE